VRRTTQTAENEEDHREFVCCNKSTANNTYKLRRKRSEKIPAASRRNWQSSCVCRINQQSPIQFTNINSNVQRVHTDTIMLTVWLYHNGPQQTTTDRKGLGLGCSPCSPLRYIVIPLC